MDTITNESQTKSRSTSVYSQPAVRNHYEIIYLPLPMFGGAQFTLKSSRFLHLFIVLHRQTLHHNAFLSLKPPFPSASAPRVLPPHTHRRRFLLCRGFPSHSKLSLCGGSVLLPDQHAPWTPAGSTATSRPRQRWRGGDMLSMLSRISRRFRDNEWTALPVLWNDRLTDHWSISPREALGRLFWALKEKGAGGELGEVGGEWTLTHDERMEEMNWFPWKKWLYMFLW